MLRCTRSERAAAAVTALLLLHHGEWCAWHVLAVTGRLVGAGEAAVAAWSRSRERTGAEPPAGGGPTSEASESAVRYILEW